jgi:hypothetical protein
VLTFGFSDFLFSVVSQQHVVQGFVGHETGTYLVVVHTLVALVGEIFGDVEVAVLGWFDDLSVDFEGEGSEMFVVDSSACEYVFFDVFAEGFDDEVELGFGVEGFEGFGSAWLRGLVFSRVVLGVGDDPE